jgi:hypothetical protein
MDEWMNSMRAIVRAVLLLGVVSALAGCATKHSTPGAMNLNARWYWDEAFASEFGGPEIPSSLRHDLTVWAFDFLFHEPGTREKVVPGVKYIGVGSGTYPWYEAPDSSVISALKKKGYDVRPCSELRFPERDEMEPGNPGRYRGIEHRETGERAYIYYVTLERMISPMLVRVCVGHYNGPLAGGGQTYLLQKRNGVWKIFVCIENSIS